MTPLIATGSTSFPSVPKEKEGQKGVSKSQLSSAAADAKAQRALEFNKSERKAFPRCLECFGAAVASVSEFDLEAGEHGG
eukprot:jgi/Bigna1/128829/aug1.7_g3537